MSEPITADELVVWREMLAARFHDAFSVCAGHALLDAAEENVRLREQRGEPCSLCRGSGACKDPTGLTDIGCQGTGSETVARLREENVRLRAEIAKHAEVDCHICNDTGYLDDAEAWDCGGQPNECPYCPEKVKAALAEVERLKEELAKIKTPLIGDVFAQARAWVAVFTTCENVGMLSFLGNVSTGGRGRVCEFIEHLAAELARLQAGVREERDAVIARIQGGETLFEAEAVAARLTELLGEA